MLAKLPVQFTAIDKLVQARVERPDMIVFKVNLNKRFPVEIVMVDNGGIKVVAGEVEILLAPELFQDIRNLQAFLLVGLVIGFK